MSDPMTPNQKKKGAPPKIHLDPAKVEELASHGLSFVQICDALGIGRSTLDRRRKESEAIEEAIRRGKAKGISEVTNALFQQALSGNTAAAIFFLKNQAGWRDKIDLEVEQTVPLPLVVHVPIEGPVIDAEVVHPDAIGMAKKCE